MILPVLSFFLRLVFSPFGCCTLSVYTSLRSVLFLPHLLQFACNAGYLCVGVRFVALQYLHGRLLTFLFFSFVPNRSILCFASSLNVCFLFVDIKATGIVFILFSFPYVFCFITSNVFFLISSVFSSIFCPVFSCR